MFASVQQAMAGAWCKLWMQLGFQVEGQSKSLHVKGAHQVDQILIVHSGTEVSSIGHESLLK